MLVREDESISYSSLLQVLSKTEKKKKKGYRVQQMSKYPLHI